MDIIYSETHRQRAPKFELNGGLLVPPFECPERLDFILAEANKRGFAAPHAPSDHGMAPIQAVHDADYLDFLATCWDEWQAMGFKGEAIANIFPSRRMTRLVVPSDIEGKLGYYCLANETAISPGTWEAAQGSAQVALSGADRLIAGQRAAFALCRPPGHHAAQDMFGGYCFLNNAGIAAQHLRDQGAARVAILDVDFHHGNGTQAMFYDRPDVLVVNLHGDPDFAFPHFLGGADERGEGAGEGATLNYPLPEGCSFARWFETLETALSAIQAWGAEALVVSLGVDTYEGDPISAFKLKSADFTTYGERLGRFGLPTLFVMEGGYAVEAIGVNTINVLDGFAQV